MLELVLMRAKNTLNVTNGAISKIIITDICWMLPMIKVSDIERIKLLSVLENDELIPVDFRSWQLYENPSLPQATNASWNVTTSSQMQKPRMVIIALQTDRNKTTADNSKFDLGDVRDVSVYLNDKKYPHHSFGVNNTNGVYGILYEAYARFQDSYYGRTPSPMLKTTDFVKNTPVFVIDCSRQSEDLKSGACTTRVEISSATNIPANTRAYCLILHDRRVEYTALSNIVTNVV